MKLLLMLFICGIFLIGTNCFAASQPNAQNNYSDNLLIEAVAAAADSVKIRSDSESFGIERESAEPRVLASAALVIDQQTGAVLFEKNADYTQPIASITKLMTAIVVLDANLPLEETIIVSAGDAALARPTQSKLKVGARFTRAELLRLMLMASENRAAAALARNYPGGLVNFVRRMNETAQILGLSSTRFVDPTGLNATNVSTARELTQLVRHAYHYEAIRAYSTTPEYSVALGRARQALFHNTNRLTRSDDWLIGLSKTGTISASGQCLVLQATLTGRALVMVILDSWGKGGRTDDAMRLRNWLERDTKRLILAGT